MLSLTMNVKIALSGCFLNRLVFVISSNHTYQISQMSQSFGSLFKGAI